MKKYPILYAILLGLIIPWLLFTGRQNVSYTTESTDSSSLTTTTAAAAVEQNVVSVLNSDGEVEQMELEKYLLGVLIGEMPADFELEALKAQAVVARTLTIKSVQNGGKHNDFDICVDSSCCQEYYASSDFLVNGGTQEQLMKFQQAIDETRGQVLLYNGELIEATYFSCSGGRTEDAQAVWGSEVPYLQAIDSPGEEKAKHYMDTVCFTVEEFQRRIGQQLDGFPGSWIGFVNYTDGGGVASICIGGTSYTGTQLRQKLGLNSTSFVISAVGDTVTVTTKGFGHRVGMSQYGADAMALQGKTYEQILAYYYQGTNLSTYDNI